VQFYPGKGKIGHSNNLRRKTGSPVFAAGQPMVINGRVVDRDCVPVMGAVVEMWQANSYGRYNNGNGKKNDAAPDPDFAGSGSAVTDNNGEFQFVTVYPGSFGTQSPRLFFRILKQLTKADLNTVIYLADSPMTYSDASVKKLKDAKREQLLLIAEPYDDSNANRGYHLEVNFVLGEEQKYREF
jgi:protocatechuate 3,4-dioxygenase beta subunit